MGPTTQELEEARQAVAELSPEQKAGQVIMATYDGTAPPVDLVEDYHLGGVITMGYNVDSGDQVAQTNAELSDEVADDREWPLLISVDQEGGQIVRLEDPFTEFPTYLSLGAAGSPDLATDVAEASGSELRATGFNMVFAPVADVASGPDDPTIGSRSAGDDPVVVADAVIASTQGYAESGVVPVVKHFPGHGSVPVDSHETLPTQDASVDDLRERDLVPFERATEAGVPAMMVAHIDVQDVDSGTPSSLSVDVVDTMLRTELGFDGLVVTDALNMAAITNTYGSAEAGVQALLAGSDLLLMPADVATAHAGILDALADGRLPHERLDEAATRVVALAIHQRDSSAEQPTRDEVGQAGETSYAASLAAATMVSGPCEPERIVDDSVEVVGGNESDRERFTEAARAAGLEVGGGTVVRLLGFGDGPGTGDIVVALDTPYALGDSDASVASIGLYGRTPHAFQALVDVLLGNEAATGRLPVEVPGVERDRC